MNMIDRCRKENPGWRNSVIEGSESLIRQFLKSDSILFLNWDEAKEMSQVGISFGCHTLTHYNLTTCPKDEAQKEVSDSKKTLGKS